jgi:hypothetical protein
MLDDDGTETCMAEEEKKSLLSGKTVGGGALQIGAHRSWQSYLRGLSATQGGPLTPFRVRQIREFWEVIERSGGGAGHPHAMATEEGGFSMTWDKGRHHFEIEVNADGTYGWFYMDRDSDLREGEEDLYLGSYSPAMFSYLRRTLSEEQWS